MIEEEEEGALEGFEGITFGMLALGLLVAFLFAAAMFKVSPKNRRILWPIGTTGWVGLVSSLALRGVYDRWTPPPPMMLTLVVALGFCVWLAFSRHGARLATLPFSILILFHAFRLPLELLMHRAYETHVMPVQMSYSGRNFDILTGATALIVGGMSLVKPLPRAVLLAWNALGTALLLNIMAIGILSTPMISLWGPDAQNRWIAYFPHVLLPTVMVPATLIGHLVLWRKLLGAPKEASANTTTKTAPAT